MCLRLRPFPLSYGRDEAKHMALPNATCPGLHQKPLDAVIGGLNASYCPDYRQGNNQQNDDIKCTNFADRFDGHHIVAVLNHVHCLMEEVRGFHKSH